MSSHRPARTESRFGPAARGQLEWTVRRWAGDALAPGEELLGAGQGYLRRFGEKGEAQALPKTRWWTRAVPFYRGLAIVAYTREQLMFLAEGFGVNCTLTELYRAELGEDNHQVFVFGRPESPLSFLELSPIDGRQARQFLDGLLAVRDEECEKLLADARTAVEERRQRLLGHGLERIWEAATSPKPRTVVGQWLRATLLGQDELADRLRSALNNGEPGWNYEEPFVAGFACEIAVRRLFPGPLDVRAVTAFVDDMRGRIHGTEAPDRKVSEDLMRGALGDHSVSFAGVSLEELFHCQLMITAAIVLDLGLDEVTIDEIIVGGERSAFDAGRHPPLATALKLPAPPMPAARVKWLPFRFATCPLRSPGSAARNPSAPAV